MIQRELPPDVDATSRCRLPLPRREELDEAGRQAFDRANRPGTIAGLQGPAGIQLHSPGVAPHLSALNTYLRLEAGLSAEVREIAILATAREMDSQFEWVAHEPQALKDGVSRAAIDVIKHRRSTAGLGDEEALVIELARQLWRSHKVDAETFAKLKATYGPRKVIDLVVLMGTYANTAAMLAVVDMQIPDGKEPLLPIP
jgi:4-carboxymuconolactone decarboxylase